MKQILFSLVTLAAACKGTDNAKLDPAPAPGSAVSSGMRADPGSAREPQAPGSAATGSATAPADCASQTAALESWLTTVMDPAMKVAAPWPTGDATFDAELEKHRAAAREQQKPAEPSKKVKMMAPGVTTGALEAELATCPEATAQLAKVSTSPPDQSVATFVGVADAIAACGCKPSIPRVKALLYLSQRGPD